MFGHQGDVQQSSQQEKDKLVLISNNEIKFDPNDWKQVVNCDDDSAQRLFENLKATKHTHEQLIEYLAFWLQHSPRAHEDFQTIYNDYIDTLKCNSVFTVLQYEEALWDQILFVQMKHGETLFHDLINHHSNPAKLISFIWLWLKHERDIDRTHYIYHHSIKFEPLLDMSGLADYMSLIDLKAKAHALSIFIAGPLTIFSDESQKWLEAGSGGGCFRLFCGGITEPTPGSAFKKVLNNKYDAAVQELKAIEEDIETKLSAKLANTSTKRLTK